MYLLKLGSKGSAVKKLQKQLNYYGYNLTIDGNFNKQTEEAVMCFQSIYQNNLGQSLSVDGVVGQETHWAIKAYIPKKEETALVSIPEDSYTIKRIKLLHPLLVDEALAIYETIRLNGVAVRFTSTYRTVDAQNELYALGRTKPGSIVTKVKGGFSYHNFGLAIDFCLLLNEGKTASWSRTVDIDEDGKADWIEVVDVFEKHGWEWGGRWQNFKDFPHFQKTFNYTTSQLRQLYNSNTIDAKKYVLLA